jgi:hypothetical protein
VLAAICLSSVEAQQVKVSTPFQQINDGFYENFNIGWGFSRRRPNGSGFFFNGPGGAPPAFGGYDPNSDGHLGFGTAGRNGSGFFNFSFGQGNSRSMVSTTPSVVVPNGYGGTITSVNQRPFVTGFIPVVGGLPATPPPVYSSPLGSSREQVYQNVQRIHEQVSAQRKSAELEEKKRDDVVLAEERKRLRERARTGTSSDDPPLRLNGQ